LFGGRGGGSGHQTAAGKRYRTQADSDARPKAGGPRATIAIR